MQPTWQTDDGSIRLYLGDVRDVVGELPEVDCVVTSPPYWNQRTYGSGVEGWDSIMDPMLQLRTSPSAQVLVNLGQVHRSGSVVPYWEGWRDRMTRAGWRFFGWYVWDQGSGLPGDWNGRLAPSHEFVLHFNREARRPHKLVPCKSVGRAIHGTGLRKADGTTAARQSHHGRPVQPFKIPDSVIRVTREMRRDLKHPARFPVAFADALISPFSNPGEIVCDPFMGSGTAAIACVRNGRRFIGVEKNREYFEEAVSRIAKEAAARPTQSVA